MLKQILSKASFGVAILLAPLYFGQTVLAMPTPNNVYVSPIGSPTGNCDSPADACNFSQALTEVNEFGTIHVASGNYNESLNIFKSDIYIVADSDHGPQVTIGNSNTGYGVAITGANNVSIKGLDFIVPPESSIGYALHAYQSRNLLLQNDNFTGTGSHAGGVDINSSPNVTEQDVSATGFAKNGFSFTAQYNTGDQVGSSIFLTNISSTDNHWSGIAFYTKPGSGNSHGHNIGDVNFNGTNTISGNGQSGIYFDGGNDFSTSVAPTYNISGPGDKPIDLGHTNFSGNTFDIVNYQHKKVLAIAAQFGGNIGNAMSNTERSAEQSKVFDHVIFYQQAHATNPPSGAIKKNAGTLSWSKVKDAVSYEYHSTNINSNVKNSDNSLNSAIIYDTIVQPNHINASGTTQGTYWWQVRPIFPDSSHGVWSNPSSITVKP
jgi:hypothetical protein